MIFNSDKRYNPLWSDSIIHGAIFISISLNLFSSNYIVDFFLLTCMIIYLSKGYTIKWHYSLLIFLWGVYSDLIIGYPIGYSSTIFLFFLLINQISNYFGIFFIDAIRFLIFFVGLFFVLTFENLFIYLQFNASISIFLQIIKILFILLFYYPINNLMKNNFNLYAPKE
tara:strand:+ start:443 stop:949 length:507 start_codon:yes stop_codon:yes gene_type:complete